MPNGDKDKMPVEDYAVGLYRSMYTDYLNPPCEPSEALPDYFVTADKLSTDQHIDMLAALQPYVDSSISKTVNCPVDISFDAFRSVYQRAYDSGCKSVSTFRPNDIRGSVLTTDASSVQDKLPETILTLTPRPEELSGSTYKLKVEDNSPAIYITINDETDANGRKRPYEVFINTKDTEHYAWIVALTLMISAVFRRGGDVAFVAHELKAMFDPRGSFWHKGRQIPSTVAAIGEIIERHMRKIGFVQDQTATAAAPAQPAQRSSKPCPRCASFMHRHGDCIECSNCGYTKCD
jgi:ribonucleoside-diphosphate reductase alpha chain